MKTFLFFIFIFLVTFAILNGSILCADDIYFDFLFDGLKPFKNFLFGTWLMHFLNIFLYYIPYKLNINIQDWNATFGCILKSGIITILFVYLYKILMIKTIKKNIAISYIFILFCIFWILQSKTGFVDLIITQGFYRFIFTSCLYEIFIYYCLKVFLDHKINIIYLSVFSLILSTSSEIIGCISLFSSFIFLVYSLFKDKLKIKSFLILFLCILLGVFLLSLTPGFTYNLERKLGNYSFNLIQIIEYIPQYTASYIKRIILDYGVFYIMLGVFTIISIWQYGKINTYKNFKNSSEYKLLLSSYIILFSFLLFSYSLIIFGKTSYDNYFWIKHRDFYTIVQIIFMIILTIQSNLFFTIVSNNIKHLSIVIYLIVILIIFPTFEYCMLLHTTLQNIRNVSYLRDKMQIFYAFKNIPCKLAQFSKYLMFNEYVSSNKFNPFENKYVPILVTEENEARVANILAKDYYSIVYKVNIDLTNDITVTDNNEEAMNYYIQNGGTYSEIITEKYKFSSLESKDYVLNVSK